MPGWSDLNETQFERRFQTVLHDGLFAKSAAKTIEPALDISKIVTPNPPPTPTGLEIIFPADPTVYDGRFANNGWLQELPKPITKLAWDNAALISPATAFDLNLAPKGNLERAFEANDKVITITVGPSKVDAAVTVVPGLADGTIVLHLGYGRTKGGNLANGTGFNAYKLRTSDAMHIATGLQNPVFTGGTYSLAHVRAYHSIDPTDHKTEELIRVLPIEEFAATKKLDKDEAAVNPMDRTIRESRSHCIGTQPPPSTNTRGSAPTTGACRSTTTCVSAAMPA